VLSKNSAPKKKKRFIFWILLALYVSLIFYFTPYAYPALKFLMGKTKLNLNLGISLLGIFMFIYFYLALIKIKNLRTLKTSLILSFIVMGYIILFVIFTKNPVERFHLFEYGVLSYFIYQALAIDLHEENLYGWGMVIVILVSSLDELFQVSLPHRFGDLKDIFINCLSGLLGFLALNTTHKPYVIENDKKITPYLN
jgi:magnesium-transporting ATPase (P-type)